MGTNGRQAKNSEQCRGKRGGRTRNPIYQISEEKICDGWVAGYSSWQKAELV
jgi:hypothetical protein